jgi:hypothetical protein
MTTACPPESVIDFVLRATSQVGDTVLMPTGGPIGSVLRRGRRPLAFESDEAKHLENIEQARPYYLDKLAGKVEIK